ncbi:uncharacterized protein LOC123541471 [Mercenaria mercenaria]|uniref:uncharacterized protein LOC123541471 n=1 Tax=Mercenaria mercenaria TaxID=6596 RepID=UPI001E1D737A|nr:uncharacterized protein LOC123541471 [Mercenaria mercenaria]
MLAVIGIALNGLALILEVVGVIIPYWFIWSTSVHGLTASIKFGLWKCCTEVPLLDSECTSLEDIIHPISNQIRVTRGLEILSVLTTAMAGALAFLRVVTRKDNRRFVLAAGINAGIAGLLAIVGAVVFAVDNQVEKYLEEHAFKGQTNLKLHSGFGLCIVSGILSFITAVLYILAFCSKSNIVHSIGT